MMIHQRVLLKTTVNGQVFYFDIDGDFKVINNIESSYTISQVQQEIWSTSGIPPSQLMLKYGGRILDPTRSLSSYGIQEGSFFHLQLRLRGGSGGAEDYETAMDYTAADLNNNEEAAAIADSIEPNGVEQHSAFSPIDSNIEEVAGTADAGVSIVNDSDGDKKVAASSTMASESDNVVGAPQSNAQIIDEIEEICNDKFPPGKRFPTLEALKTELTALGKKWGFGISGSGKQLTCSRYGKTRTSNNDSKKRTRVNALKCNCEFTCYWGYVIPTFPHPNIPNTSAKNAEFRTTPRLQEVKIQPTSKYRHSNGCEPCYEQFQFQARRTGTLFTKESEKMNDLLSILQLGKWRMDNETLRGHLSIVNPCQTYISADELRNFRMWAKKEVVKRSTSGKYTVLTEQDLKVMFTDHITRPDSSVAIEDAEKLYRELLQSTMESGGNTWNKVEQYLKLLKKEDVCFDYRILRDRMSGAATMVLWQTGTMRGDFELYGCALHLDFMKRQLNSYEWPYISIVAMDSNGSPRVVAEGIACTERNEAYVAAVQSLLAMSPGRTNENVLAVFADGALNADILLPHNMNLPNAKFIWDSFHLSTDIWPKDFGGAWTDTLSAQLNCMLYANSKEEFDTALSTIEAAYNGNSNILNKVHKIASKKECYAKYLLMTYEGTCGKTSNNPAEQNHSSIIAHLGGKLYEDPSYEIKLLLGRQSEHEKKRNQERTQYAFMIPAEISKSAEIKNTPALKTAKQKLEVESFKQWQNEYHNSRNYKCDIDPTTGSRTFTHCQHPNSPRVLCKNERCSCATRVQYLTQCRHEIAEQDEGQEFRLDLIDRRHHFYPKLHTKVNRDSNIDGNICRTAATTTAPPNDANSNSNSMIDDNNDNDDIVDDTLMAPMSSPVSMRWEHHNTARSKKIAKVTYTDITKVTNEFAALAVSRGQESARQAYGLAIQLEEMIRSDGGLIEGSVEDIIQNYQHTFSGTATGSVSFSLDGDAKQPPKPPPRPGSRQIESRMHGKVMDAIKGGKRENHCTFCCKSSAEGCGNVRTCKAKRKFGIHLKGATRASGGVDEVALLHTYIKSCRNSGTEHLLPWSADGSVLQKGVPTVARHIVVHGFFSYQSESGPMIVVGAIQFLVEGGNEVDDYTYLPITLDELEKILYQDFKAKGKYVFVNETLYSVLQA